MSDSKALRDAAAILLAEADRLDGKPTDYLGVNMGNPQEAWKEMLRQIAERDAARVPEARCYETHKYLWKAAEREGWPEYPNSPNRYWSGNFLKSPQLFTASIVALMKTQEALKWLADPLNAHQIPKVEPSV